MLKLVVCQKSYMTWPYSYHRALGVHAPHPPISGLNYFETELPTWNLQTPCTDLRVKFQKFSESAPGRTHPLKILATSVYVSFIIVVSSFILALNFVCNSFMYMFLLTVWHVSGAPRPLPRLNNKKHLKNVGPIRHCEPPHAHSPGVATVARQL